MLYFENLSQSAEDEYFRDGMTEDIITELLGIKGLEVFPRATVLGYRNKQVTPTEVGEQLNAAYVLSGSLRRAGNRLRITTQLVETRTGRSVWGERFDREMKDVFEVQDEIARRITEALRITLSPQEEAEIARKPTEDLQAYDFYLRGRNYARRENLDFALQMFEQAIKLDPGFALAHAGVASVCGLIYELREKHPRWIERGLEACDLAMAADPGRAEVLAARARVFYGQQKFDEAAAYARLAVEKKPDCEGAYNVLGRAYFASDRFQEAAAIVDKALEASGDDYNVYIPYASSLMRLGNKEKALKVRELQTRALERQLEVVPDDVRARVLLATNLAAAGNKEEAIRHLQTAVVLRPDDGNTLYNAACVYGVLEEKVPAMDMVRRALDAGYANLEWMRWGGIGRAGTGSAAGWWRRGFPAQRHSSASPSFAEARAPVRYAPPKRTSSAATSVSGWILEQRTDADRPGPRRETRTRDDRDPRGRRIHIPFRTIRAGRQYTDSLTSSADARASQVFA